MIVIMCSKRVYTLYSLKLKNVKNDQKRYFTMIDIMCSRRVKYMLFIKVAYYDQKQTIHNKHDRNHV